MKKELCSKCVKIIDSNITKSTTWYRRYSYVITSTVTVLENVCVNIENGTNVYILNGGLPPAGLIFNEGSSLVSKEWNLGSVNEVDGKYVVVKQESSSNGGLNLYGSKETSDEYLEKNETYSSKKIKSLGKETNYKICKINCIATNIFFINIQPKDICINEINIKNNQNSFTFPNLFVALLNTELVINNVICSFSSNSLSSISYSSSQVTVFYISESSVTIRKNLICSGVGLIAYREEFSSLVKLILEKCCYLDISSGFFVVENNEVFPPITYSIQPKNLYLPNLAQSSWNYKGKILDKTTITYNNNNS